MTLKNLTYHNFLSALNVPCNCAAFGCDHVDYWENCTNPGEEPTYPQGRQSQIAHWLVEHPDPVKFLLSCGYELYQVGNLLAKAEGLIKNYGFIYESHSFPVYRGPLC